jgi:hypothetical protein
MWLHLLLCCAAGDQQGAQLLRLSCCALRCRGALLLRSPADLLSIALLDPVNM